METKVILDCLGGDNGVMATLPAAMSALDSDKALKLVLVGDEQKIRDYKNMGEFINSGRVEVIHTTVNIEMNEHPAQAIRTKPDSSIVKGVEALKSREDCSAMVSAGSTGALLTGGFMKLGRIAGVSRPALCASLPTIDRKGVMVLDLGANMDCKPINLLHFAVMADIYAREKGLEKPRVGLLSVGAEDEKGNELTLETFKLLKESGLNFVGNIEARDVVMGKCDIVVADGFVGNVLLKTLEGTAKLFSKELKSALKGSVVGKILVAPRLLKMKKRLGEDAKGGAIFLGVKKPLLKAHGNSGPSAIATAILQASKMGAMSLSEKIGSAIAKCQVTE
ncbi:MAG: phosphate acyltransferase PlsX [Firmicutes bacterium]|nr:phosphate acyltransferase PlsX [Bacillota bacterium]